MIIGVSGRIGSGKDTIARAIQYLVYSQTTNFKNDTKFIAECLKDSNLNLNELERISGWQVKKFAGRLKEIVALLIGCSLNNLEDQEFKSTPLGREWDKFQIYDYDKPRLILTDEDEVYKYLDENTNSQHSYSYERIQITPRWLLQQLGTEIGRQIIHPNLWVNSLFNDYKLKIGEYDKILIEDSYPNWIITDVRFPNEALAIRARGGIVIRVERHRRFDEDQFYNLIMNKLDNPNPNMDLSHEFAKRLDLEYDENTEEYVDVEDIHRGKEHDSETGLDNHKHLFHATIHNNGTIEELVEIVKTLMTSKELNN